MLVVTNSENDVCTWTETVQYNRNMHMVDFTLQVEGAFTQGYGLFLLEDYRTSPKGALLTVGPGAYKLPSIGNTPCEFNVFLLHDASNPRNICSSKV